MKKRDINIEWIRVLSCLFVIVIHVSNHYRRNIGDISITSYGFSMIVNVITRMAVPFFFMISGALLLRREPETSHKRIFQAMKTLAFWTVVYALWEVFFKGNEVSLIGILYEPVTKHFWYMYVMIGIYIALPYMQTLFKHLTEDMQKRFLWIWFGILVFTFISSFFKLKPDYEIPFIGSTTYYFGYFILGSYLYEHQNNYKRQQSLWIAISCLAALCIWSFSTNTVEKVLHYKNFFLVIASACMFHYLLGIKKVPLNERFLEIVSACSLGIYYIHIIFLDIFKVIDFLPIHAIIGIPLITIIVFGLSLGSIYLSHKLRLSKKG